MDEQRAEFEAWAHKTHYNLGVGPNGLYQSGNTSSAWASWQAATQRQQERIAELDAWNEKLASYLANCRDAFPVPAVGSDLESDWTGAMADPDHVSEYVRAQVQALRLDAARYRELRHIESSVPAAVYEFLADTGGPNPDKILVGGHLDSFCDIHMNAIAAGKGEG